MLPDDGQGARQHSTPVIARCSPHPSWLSLAAVVCPGHTPSGQPVVTSQPVPQQIAWTQGMPVPAAQPHAPSVGYVQGDDAMQWLAAAT